MSGHPLLQQYLTLVLNRVDRLAEGAHLWASPNLEAELWALQSDARCVQHYLNGLLREQEAAAHGTDPETTT